MPPIGTVIMMPNGIIPIGVVASPFVNSSCEVARLSAPLVPLVLKLASGETKGSPKEIVFRSRRREGEESGGRLRRQRGNARHVWQ